MSRRTVPKRDDKPIGPRDYGQTKPARAPGTTVTCTRCRAFYVDDDGGRSAHRVVFGHQPTTEQPEG